MKTFEKYFWVLCVVCIMPFMQACDKEEGYSVGQFAYTLATARIDDAGNSYLDSDDFGTLLPVTSDWWYYPPADGQRLYVMFNPLYDDYEGYDIAIKLEGLYPVLTKQVEDLTAENEADYGDDPVVIYQNDIWVSNGYLNIVFQQDIPYHEKHRVSLVRNTTKEYPDDGYVYLEYRYNTYNDFSGVWTTGMVSYNLNSIDFTGKKGLKIRLNSKVNGEVEVCLDIKQNMEYSGKAALSHVLGEASLK